MNSNATDLIVTGNAINHGNENNSKGWFVGSFIDSAQGLRSTDEIEVKWGVHTAKEKKKEVTHQEKGTTLTILINGAFVIEFPDFNRSVNLSKAGDYVIFAPQVKHFWKALEDSVVLTVRWPSGMSRSNK